MKNRKKLFAFLTALLGIFVLIGCQPKRVSSEENNSPTIPKAQATPDKSKNEEPITIAAVGDIMLGSTSIDETFLPLNDGRDMLKEFAPLSAIWKVRCSKAEKTKNVRPNQRAASPFACRLVTANI